MSVNHIGINISILRKQAGVTQDELARHIGVSAQAVSKWENGGAPDTELLPKIADYFNVSIDNLFGRDKQPHGALQPDFVQTIIGTPIEKRFKVAFEYCWDIERALTGNDFDDCGIAEYTERIDASHQQYSSMLFDEGFTRMGIGNRLQYFLLVPEIPDKNSALFSGINYPSFFKHFADEDFFSALIFLNQRDHKKSFTPRLLEKHLRITKEKAYSIIGVLKKYHMISSTFIEIDDTTQEFFSFSPTPSLIALLIFAREIIDKPNSFSYYHQCRQSPYLSNPPHCELKPSP